MYHYASMIFEEVYSKNLIKKQNILKTLLIYL